MLSSYSLFFVFFILIGFVFRIFLTFLSGVGNDLVLSQVWFLIRKNLILQFVFLNFKYLLFLF